MGVRMGILAKSWFGEKLKLFQRIYGPEAERNFYESQMIILDTLEQVLNSVSMMYYMIDLVSCYGAILQCVMDSCFKRCL